MIDEYFKDIIELQEGCKATCVVISNDDIKELEPKTVLKSKCKFSELLNIFKNKVLETDEKIHYFIIEGIDELNYEEQDRFYQIVKDREFCGYYLPENTIMVLTVENKESLKNISDELYHLCVVAF